MATRIEPFAVTTPAGTAIVAYQVTPLPFREGDVTRIEIVVPPGPSGLVGFRVAHSGQSVVPYTDERWIVTDDEKLTWELTNLPHGEAWELWSYNLDVYDHTIYLRIHVNDAMPIAVAPPRYVPISATGTAEDDPVVSVSPDGSEVITE